jgi:hypothetical protein
MNRSFSRTSLALLILGCAAITTGASGRLQKTEPESASKLVQILDKSGFKYTKVENNLWTIQFNGKSLTDFPVMVTSVENIVLIQTVPVRKAEIKQTPELLHLLLRKAMDLDRVKVCLDDEDDLFIRIDTTARLLDVEEFKQLVNQVAAATDEIHLAVKKFLK